VPSQLTHVIKRTGDVVPFTPERISNAIYRAAVAVGGRDRATAEKLAQEVIAILEESTPAGAYPTVEEIQGVHPLSRRTRAPSTGKGGTGLP
jgi:uridine kinase